jgi:hypothetical protein
MADENNLASTDASGIEKLAPVPPEGVTLSENGKPTIGGLARGNLANSTISVSNSDLAHVCDISPGIKYEIAKFTMDVTGLIQTIRTEIEALWAGASASPFADEIRNAVTTIKAKIKTIQKFIRDQMEPLKDIQEYIQSLQELAAYILSLPGRIAKFLQECLAAATAGISEAVDLGKQIQAQVTSGAISEATADIALQEAVSADASKEVAFNKPVFEKI